MKAFQIARYSKTDLSVQLTELERPQLAPHEVLIQVKAAGVNPLDNMVTRGEVRLIVPYQLPLTMGGLPIAPGKYLIVSPMVGMIPNAVVLGAGLLLWARRTGRLRRGR